MLVSRFTIRANQNKWSWVTLEPVCMSVFQSVIVVMSVMPLCVTGYKKHSANQRWRQFELLQRLSVRFMAFNLRIYSCHKIPQLRLHHKSKVHAVRRMTVIQNKNETLFNLFPTLVLNKLIVSHSFIRWRQASRKQLRGEWQKGTELPGSDPTHQTRDHVMTPYESTVTTCSAVGVMRRVVRGS